MNTVIAIILYACMHAWTVRCIELFDIIKSNVAMQVWLHDYVDCTSFKFTSVASQKFIP